MWGHPCRCSVVRLCSLGTPLACCIAFCYVRRRRTSKDRKRKAADTIPLSASRSIPASIYRYPSPSPPPQQQQHLYYQRHHPQHHLQQTPGTTAASPAAAAAAMVNSMPATSLRVLALTASLLPAAAAASAAAIPAARSLHLCAALGASAYILASLTAAASTSRPRFSSPFSYPPPLYRPTDPEHPRPPAHTWIRALHHPRTALRHSRRILSHHTPAKGAMSAWDTHSSAGGDGNTWIAGGHHQQATAPSKPIKLVDSGSGECSAAWSASQGQAGSPLRRTTRRRTTTTVTEEEETEYVRTSSVDEDLLDDKAVDKQHYARHYLKSSPAADDGKHRRHDRGGLPHPIGDGMAAQPSGTHAASEHKGSIAAECSRAVTTATNVQARLPAALAVMSRPSASGGNTSSGCARGSSSDGRTMRLRHLSLALGGQTPRCQQHLTLRRGPQ